MEIDIVVDRDFNHDKYVLENWGENQVDENKENLSGKFNSIKRIK